MDETKLCDNCGECDRCDLDSSKICDNCGRCIEVTENYAEIKIDKIIISITAIAPVIAYHI